MGWRQCHRLFLGGGAGDILLFFVRQHYFWRLVALISGDGNLIIVKDNLLKRYIIWWCRSSMITLWLSKISLGIKQLLQVFISFRGGAWNSILTKDNLAWWSILNINSFLCCGMCEKEENVSYLYSECELFRSIWHNILKWLDNYCVLPINSCVLFILVVLSCSKKKSLFQFSVDLIDLRLDYLEIHNAKKSGSYFELNCWWNNAYTCLGYCTSWFGSFVSLYLKLCIFLF